MIKGLFIVYNQYMQFKQSAITPITKKASNKQNNLLDDLDDTMNGVFPSQLSKKEKTDVGVLNSQQSGSSLRLLFNKFALELQTKPMVSTIIISYMICVLYHLLNPYTISRLSNSSSGDVTQGQEEIDINELQTTNDDSIMYIVLQLLAQDYFIFTSLRLFCHDKFLRKIEIKDLLLSFWFLYGCCTFSLLILLVFITSHWMNMLIFTTCYCILMFQYKKEQNSVKNLFQISMNFEQLLRNSRRRFFEGENQENGEENNEQEPNQQNGNQANRQEGEGYDSDEHDDNNHQQTVRLNSRRVNSNPRPNPIVTELVQQFIGEHYERNQVSQLIQVGLNKWLVIYKVNYIKYATLYSGKIKIVTQKMDSNCIVLKYYWDSISKQPSPYSNEEVKKKYINIGIMYNTFTGKIMIFSVNVKGIKYLTVLDIGVVNKDHIVLHQQQPKFVTLRLRDLIFRNLIKNEMSSQTLVDYQNRNLQLYYSIDDTDYVVSVEEETLIISTILSTVEWKPVGNDWEMELMTGDHQHSSNLSQAQNTLLRNHSYYDKKQYFIQQKTKTKDFPTNIKCVNILNRRHLFVQDESHFYIYSIPTSQILHTLPNNYVQGFSIIPILSTVLSPNLNIDQFLKIQNYTQKSIADALVKYSNQAKNSAITTENPALIYLSQYTSIPISFSKNENGQDAYINFIQPKNILSQNASTINLNIIFQIQSVSLKSILESNNQ